MVDKCRVICHMMTSIDGKMSGICMLAPLNGRSGDYYKDVLVELGDSLAGGANTLSGSCSCPDVDFSEYEDVPVPEGDHVDPVPGSRYLFCFDRDGRCNWGSDVFEYGGRTYTVVVVLTGRVPGPFRARLKETGVQYIEAGKDEMDIPLALRKISDLFGVRNLVLSGGDVINGAFFKADAVDEISVVMAPYIEGDSGKKDFIEAFGPFHDTRFVFERSNALDDGGVHLTFVRGA